MGWCWDSVVWGGDGVGRGWGGVRMGEAEWATPHHPHPIPTPQHVTPSHPTLSPHHPHPITRHTTPSSPHPHPIPHSSIYPHSASPILTLPHPTPSPHHTIPPPSPYHTIPTPHHPHTTPSPSHPPPLHPPPHHPHTIPTPHHPCHPWPWRCRDRSSLTLPTISIFITADLLAVDVSNLSGPVEYPTLETPAPLLVPWAQCPSGPLPPCIQNRVLPMVLYRRYVRSRPGILPHHPPAPFGVWRMALQ